MEIDLNAMGDRELYAHGEAVMEAIKKRMFQAGFRAAKQAQRKLAKMNAEKAPKPAVMKSLSRRRRTLSDLRRITYG
ncbi:hypothetical protein [Bacillus velezensis]|uniref:hypothetical protein n=1 Tax=Bacillus velezensis TaxID=492670 RepID=UPI001E2DE8C3|nr:hypothetical protein [Bacillus velezensis]